MATRSPLSQLPSLKLGNLPPLQSGMIDVHSKPNLKSISGAVLKKYKPLRLAIRKAPPALALEYDDPHGKRRMHVFPLVSFSGSSDPVSVAETLFTENPKYLKRSLIARGQIVSIIQRLHRMLSEESSNSQVPADIQKSEEITETLLGPHLNARKEMSQDVLDEQGEDLSSAADLQNVSEEELARAKAQMEHGFSSHALRPGDQEYEYDKRMEFAEDGGAAANAWDSEDSIPFSDSSIEENSTENTVKLAEKLKVLTENPQKPIQISTEKPTKRSEKPAKPIMNVTAKSDEISIENASRLTEMSTNSTENSDKLPEVQTKQIAIGSASEPTVEVAESRVTPTESTDMISNPTDMSSLQENVSTKPTDVTTKTADNISRSALSNISKSSVEKTEDESQNLFDKTNQPDTTTSRDSKVEAQDSSSIRDSKIQAQDSSAIRDSKDTTPDAITVADSTVKAPDSSTARDSIATVKAPDSSTVRDPTDTTTDCTTTVTDSSVKASDSSTARDTTVKAPAADNDSILSEEDLGNSSIANDENGESFDMGDESISEEEFSAPSDGDFSSSDEEEF
eukprot:287603_1